MKNLIKKDNLEGVSYGKTTIFLWYNDTTENYEIENLDGGFVTTLGSTPEREWADEIYENEMIAWES